MLRIPCPSARWALAVAEGRYLYARVFVVHAVRATEVWLIAVSLPSAPGRISGAPLHPDWFQAAGVTPVPGAKVVRWYEPAAADPFHPGSTGAWRVRPCWRSP